MAPRGRKKLIKSSTTTSTSATQRAPSRAHEQEPHLPSEVLEEIFNRLSLKDNIRASVVCKSWQSPAISVRKANTPPWLMSYPKSGDLFEFYNPTERKNYYLDLPEMRGTRICYVKDSWLLLYKPRTLRLFFFCPYTLEKIKMPKLQLSDHIVAFSAPPTNPDCTLCMVRHVEREAVAISTCRMGENQWTTLTYECDPPFHSSMWNKLVFCDGIFYCMSLTGLLGFYDPIERTWNISTVPPPHCTDCLHLENRWRSKFMAEYEGDIYVTCTCALAEPFVYKLDWVKGVWDELVSLDGRTIFANYVSSCVRSELVGKLVGSVYFPKVLFYGKRCITYRPEGDRYSPKDDVYDWTEMEGFRSAWIEAPKNVDKFLEGAGCKGKKKRQ
ncbi:hypothetical protein ABFX02_12G153900 [Erythranthe guttata]